MVSGGQEVARFYATIGADTSGLTRGTIQARTQLASLGTATQQSATQIGGAFRAIAGAAALGVGIAGVTALTQALRAGVSANLTYETAFVGVRRVVDGTDEQFRGLDSTIRRMATESLPLTRDSLAGIATIGGQMGVPITQMEKFIDTVARVSVASNGVLSPEGAAAGLGKLSSQFQIPGNEIDKLGSAILKTADIAIGDEAQLLDILQRSAPGQRTVGFTPGQSIALGGVAMKLGNPEEVGTALGQAPMILAQLVAKGGDDLRALDEISGMAAGGFKKAWEQDAFGAFQAFTVGINRLGEGALKPLEDLGFGGQRVGRVLLGLGANQADLALQLNAANQELATGAHLADESALAFGTGASQIQIFQNQMLELSGVIAGPLTEALGSILPVLSLIADGLVGLVSQVSAMPGVVSAIGAGITSAIPGLGALGLVNKLPEVLGFDSLTEQAQRAAEIRKMRIDSAKANPETDLAPGFGEDIGATSGIATKGTQVKPPQTPEQIAALARINALLGSDKVPKLTDEQKALKSIEEKHTSDLVEAYIKGGDKRVQAVRAEQAALDVAWSGVAANLHDRLGVAVPDEFRLMWEQTQEEMRKGKKDSLSGLLGFLAARDTEHGANPLTNKFAVKDKDGNMVGGAGVTYVVEGDVNVGLRPDVVGGVDANAAIEVTARVPFNQVGRRAR